MQLWKIVMQIMKHCKVHVNKKLKPLKSQVNEGLNFFQPYFLYFSPEISHSEEICEYMQPELLFCRPNPIVFYQANKLI